MAHGVPLSVMHARHTGNTQEKKNHTVLAQVKIN